MEHITGRVTKDAQVKTFDSGRSVVNFNVVKNRYYKNKEGKRIEQAEFIQCSFWRSSNIAPFITKGQVIELLGESTADVYIDREGRPQPIKRLNVDQIIFHSAQKKAEDSKTESEQKKGKAAKDDLPF